MIYLNYKKNQRQIKFCILYTYSYIKMYNNLGTIVYNNIQYTIYMNYKFAHPCFRIMICTRKFKNYF